jgi:hypothetical protein
VSSGMPARDSGRDREVITPLLLQINARLVLPNMVRSNFSAQNKTVIFNFDTWSGAEVEKS